MVNLDSLHEAISDSAIELMEKQNQTTQTGKACANKIVPDQGLFVLFL